MPCEPYQDALVSAAAGAQVTRALRSHLLACDACRTALAEEQALHASIDAGLRIITNPAVPPSLIPSVRVRLQESALRPRWTVAQLVPAAVVLLVVLFVAREVHWLVWGTSDTRRSASVSLPAQPGQFEPPGRGAVAVSPQIARSGAEHASRGATPLVSRGENRPETVSEILVPRDQEALLADYAERWRSHRRVVLTAEQLSDAPLKPLEVAPIQIALLDVRPLVDADSR
ncbi:MAG TPA: hypothetical protein VOA78_09850 [Candidatus Dormibacteraeota bacterium]|nr:hypothetical protein [Candidatus Dormibacteraeota bacterium]